MWLNRTADPADMPVTLAEAKAHLRVLHDLDDDYIDALIETATGHLEGRGGILGRALVTQIWEYRIRCFPNCGVIQLPLPPLQTVGAIAYIDTNGATQTLSPDQYAVDAETLVGQIRRAYGVTWPATRAEDHAVRITFTAGYGDAADVPRPIKQAILLLIGHFYVNRDLGLVLPQGAPLAVEALVAPHRIGLL